MSDQNLKSSHLCQKSHSMTKAKATYILIHTDNGHPERAFFQKFETFGLAHCPRNVREQY
jgi:hypothetical protein